MVFRNPEQRRQHYIKRVIGLAGDEVEWRENGEILVNGVPLERSPGEGEGTFIEHQDARDYTIKLAPNQAGPPPGMMEVPPYHCFVLGDNRSLSLDSRSFGPIAYSGLEAAPVAKVWGGLGKLK